MRVESIETEDGSRTYRDTARGLAFRSTHGASTESRHVFVEVALRAQSRDRVRVFEFGFGGAMNFCETFCAFRDRGWKLDYVAVEADPLGPSILSHPDAEALDIAREGLARPGERVERGEQRLTVYVADGLDPQLPVRGFDTIFHDPFGPRDAPECWTEEAFRLQASRMGATGILTTYSAARHVRDAMAAAGLSVARRPGPGRKREVTLAGLRHLAEPVDLESLRAVLARV